jgi:uncharacterized hydrophobic protein (TIGR00271 family)
MPDADRPDASLTALGALVGALRDSVVLPPSSDAAEAVEELFPEGDEFVRYGVRFTVLMVLSAGIAAFGLLANSSAVVIGAMLVAPLMTPITAAAAATVMARNVRLVKSAGVIVVGTITAIAVGYVVAFLAGADVASVTELPNEVTARTFPGLLDLGIAVTAGAAAGYILPRRSTVSALPGVGIAVALVPPLATVGITLEYGFGHEAANAFLLYLTNLAAIVFAASIMLILTGFRPTTVGGTKSLGRRVLVTLAAVLVIAIPLTVHTRTTIRNQSLRSSVSNAVVAWDDSVTVLDLVTTLRGSRATVDLLVAGPNPPRPAWQLASEIEERFPGPVDLRLRYQRNDQFLVSVR